MHQRFGALFFYTYCILVGRVKVACRLLAGCCIVYLDKEGCYCILSALVIV